MKRCIAGVLAVLLAVTAAGCTKKAPQPQAVITVAVYGTQQTQQAVQAAADDFCEAHGNARAEVRLYTQQQIQQAVLAGSTEDMVMLTPQLLQQVNADGSVFADPASFSGADETLYAPAALEQCTVNGRLSALPLAQQTQLFCWNKNAFAAAGVPVPQSMDELTAAGNAFSGMLGAEAYPLALTEQQRIAFAARWLQSQYGEPWEKDGMPQYSQQQLAQALALLTDLEAAHALAPLAETPQDMREWPQTTGGVYCTQQQAQMLPQGDWRYGGTLQGMGDNPAGEQTVTACMGIRQNAADPALCAQLLQYMLAGDGAHTLGVEFGLPCTQAARAVCAADGLLPDALQAAAQEADKCPYAGSYTLQPQQTAHYADIIRQYAQGQLSAAQATLQWHEAMTADCLTRESAVPPQSAAA